MTCNESVITTHYNSLQSITFQHSQIQFCIKIAKKSLQLITIHYNSLQSITFHCKFVHVFVNLLVKPLQFITIYYNPLQSITIDSKSPFKPLPIRPSHSRNSPLNDKNHLIKKILLRLYLLG